MISATIELWPFGDQSAPKRLVTIAVANLGRNPDQTCNYAWTIDEPKPLFGIPPISTQGHIIGYSREQSCVALFSEIFLSYEEGNHGPLESFSEYDQETFSRLRLKTKP